MFIGRDVFTILLCKRLSVVYESAPSSLALLRQQWGKKKDVID